MNSEPEALVADATCLGCGCVCDDLRVRVAGARVVAIEPSCPPGSAWFSAPHPGAGSPVATVDGRPASVEDAVARAAAILSGARFPLLWDLTGLTVEATTQSVRVADRVGATIDLGGSAAAQAAFSRVGAVGATLGEIRDRADLVIFWLVDPDRTHPRFPSRFLDPSGPFVPDGRTVILVNPVGSASTSRDETIAIDPDRAGAVLAVLRGLVAGKPIDPVRAAAATGLAGDALRSLADRLAGARYGVIIDAGQSDPIAAEAMLTLVRDLNQPTGRRFVHLSLKGAGNPAGVESALLWQSGAPGSVDLAAGWPRFLPGEATWDARKDAIDALLILGDDPPDRPEGLTTIRIGPGATRADLPPVAVAISTGRPGIEAGGTAARSDGVMIPLTAVIDPGGRPDDLTMLRAIADRLGD